MTSRSGGPTKAIQRVQEKSHPGGHKTKQLLKNCRPQVRLAVAFGSMNSALYQ